MTGRPHVVVVPFPTQGHLNPTMHLSQILAKHGAKVTFVNSDFNHNNATAMNGGTAPPSSDIRLVSIPDGLEATADRNDLKRLGDSVMATMPRKFEELLSEVHRDDPVTAVVFDVLAGWAGRVAGKMGIKTVGFITASATSFGVFSSIPRFIQDGIIDHDGSVNKKQKFELYPSDPPMTMDTDTLPWTIHGDPESQKSLFNIVKTGMEDSRDSHHILCNSTRELEPGAFSISPSLLQIGPLLADYDTGSAGAQLWQEDSTCLHWLNEQPHKSVIYVSFGSHTIMGPTQFQELAEGLELTNRSFLWVVRPGLTHELNYEVKSSRGKVVAWVPQQKVLNHPSVVCFVSHCGWNSTMEGMINGVPFLCWPYFVDQYSNKAYICEVWKVGLGLEVDEDGMITKEEFKGKVERLLEDESIRINCSNFKKMLNQSVGEDGQSSKNLHDLINWFQA